MKMGIIEIEGMEFFAYHGHFSAEQLVGNHFLADLWIETNCSLAAESDRLHDALDYQKVYRIVKLEMEKPSHLLENLCNRILENLFQHFPEINIARVKVKKLNPPMGGKIASVSVMLSRKGEVID
jgi:dihydroneopterin aldolase